MIERNGEQLVRHEVLREWIYNHPLILPFNCRASSTFSFPALLTCLLAIFYTASLALCVNCTSARSSNSVLLAGVGAVVERELTGDETQSFRIPLEAEQYLRVAIEQQGVDVLIAVYEPGGKLIAEMVSPFDNSRMEKISAIAETKGDYRIEVRPASKDITAGSYKLTVEELRASIPADNDCINGQRAFMEGRNLSSQPATLQSAIGKYEEALGYWQTAGDHEQQAATLYGIGIVYRNMDNMPEAAKNYQQALSLLQDIGDRRGQVCALNELGLTYAIDGKQKVAMDYLFQALPIAQAENDRNLEALTLNILGGVHDNIGEPHKALDYFTQALDIRRALQNKSGLISTLNNIGVIYDQFGESQKALDCYAQALVIVEDLPDLTIEDHKKKASAINNVGYTYEAMGDFEKALEYYNRALPIRKESNDRRGEAHTLINIGDVYTSTGEPQKALGYYEQALSLRREVKDDWGEVYTLAYIGNAYASLGEMEKALEYYNQALRLQKRIGDRQAEASIRYKIGDAYASIGQPKRAIEYYKQANVVWKAIGGRRGEAMTLMGIARAERDLGYLSRSRTNIEAALDIIEFLRASVSSQEARILYFASIQQYYKLYVDVLMRMRKNNPSAGFNAIALQANERALARSLLENLGGARMDIHQKIEPGLLERERSLQQQLNAKARRQIELLNGPHTLEQKTTLDKELRALITQYQELEAQIKATSPAYAELTQPEPLSIEQIQQQVLDPDTLILEYSLGDECSYLWAITQHSIKSYELPGRQDLESQAELVYKLLTARQPVDGEDADTHQTRVAQADTLYWQEAGKLSQMLLGCVASQLGKKRIVIVPEGALQYVSFPALPAPVAQEKEERVKGSIPHGFNDRTSDSTRQPLVVGHEISSLPSVSVLAAIRREIANRKPAPKTVAVFADPVFSKDDERVNSTGKQQSRNAGQPLNEELYRALRGFGMTRDGLNLMRLQSFKREGEAIIKLVPKEKRLDAFNFEANLTKLRNSELEQYRIVHFATHGLLNNDNPELSALVLSLVDEQGQQQDGLLHLNHIYNMNLPVDLVVLSACDTGLGKQIRGEGLVGLTRGFMYAGAARVVASLWKVDSLETEKLMKLFYAGMLDKQLAPLQALQEAQIEMWKQSPDKAPYDWAAFILQGEWK